MRKTLSFAILSLLLAGCGPTASVFCQVAQPITYSRNDTQETRAQIVEHNAVWTELCN